MKFMLKRELKKEQHDLIRSRNQILSENSSFAEQEAYKTLRTNVRFFLQGNGCKKVCVTSGAAGEGKSMTLLNLAIAIAQAGDKVLLIDADMRRPTLARRLEEKATPGLSNVLAGLSAAKDAIRKNVFTNLDILFSGDIPPNPSELLGSEAMQKIVEDLSKDYDYILVDTPPVNVVSDACIVTNLMDGVLLLVRQDSSKKDEVRRAVQSLRFTGAKPLAFVLNGVSLEKKKKKAYGYYN